MNYLISKELCTRCGACFAADRLNTLSKDEDGYPIINNLSAENIEELKKVCSGENWDFLSTLKKQYGDDAEYDPGRPDIGIHKKIFLLSSQDENWRTAGQSGGVTTTLLRFAMDTELIDAALLVRRPERPDGNPFTSEPYIASSVDDLAPSFGSKYTICSSLEMIKELSEKSDKFAATLLPCQTMGFHRLSEKCLELKNKCKLIVGPYCGLNMEVEAGQAMAGSAGLSSEKVISFKNRGGTFPGKTQLKTNDGESLVIDRTAHRILYRMYTPLRCYTCTDYGNELADVVVADCWEAKKDGQFRYPEGAAYVICRTGRGLDTLKKAIAAGYFREHPINTDIVKKRWEASFYHRKVRAHNRIRYWEKKGVPTPKLDYPLPLPFKDSRIADTLEIQTWRLFRRKSFREKGLRLWLWLARSKPGSFRNLIFEDFKRYIFTHTYDQFRWKTYKVSLVGYKRWFLRFFSKK
jgi:coenzyme F420-reducing hydrogenase beta subunit